MKYTVSRNVLLIARLCKLLIARGRGVHSTSWKFILYFVYIFIANWNFLTKFCSSDLIFKRNILTFLYLESETLAHVQLCNECN